MTELPATLASSHPPHASLAGHDDITIVGGGFCGAMTAVQLLRRATRPLRLRLVEQSPQRLARGIAYSTTESCHLLNVPAGRMSALPEDPDHFVRWARRHEARIVQSPWVPAVGPEAYLPRSCYGDYLAELLRDTIRAASGHAVEIITDEVIATERDAQGVHVRTKSGKHWRSRACVLALGNTPPTLPGSWAKVLTGAPGYHSNPWSGNVVPELLQSQSCVLVGSGLTMLDVVMALCQRNYAGTIHVVSRRGLIPLAHGMRHAPPVVLPEAIAMESMDIRIAMRQLRGAARSAIEGGADWQSVFDALRPHTATLWQRLSTSQRRRFLRHVRPYWDHHRHRVAPVVREIFDRMVASGQVVLHQGRIEGCVPAQHTDNGDIALRIRSAAGGNVSVAGQHIVNCIGPGPLVAAPSPLVEHLFADAGVASDVLGMGLWADSNLCLVADEKLAENLFALGPPVKGNFWECTAVPECRRDTVLLADRLRSLQRIDGEVVVEFYSA